MLIQEQHLQGIFNKYRKTKYCLLLLLLLWFVHSYICRCSKFCHTALSSGDGARSIMLRFRDPRRGVREMSGAQ